MSGEYVDISIDGSAKVTGQASGGFVPAHWIEMAASSTVSGEAQASQTRWMDLAGSFAVSAGDIYANRYIKSTDINMTLYPGGKIIIDSERYYVWQNGNNITEVHSGGWIDELNRGIKAISVSTDASAVQVKVDYTERFL